MNGRRVATVVTLVVLVLALVIPPIWMLGRTGQVEAGPRADLTALSRSLNGDHTYDEQAARVLNEVERIVVNGEERYELREGGQCWELVPAVSPTPTRCN